GGGGVGGGWGEGGVMVGREGGGKGRLFNLIPGQLTPTAGHIVFEGRPITGLPPHAVARRGLSRSFQQTNLFLKLDVLENLRLAVAADGRGSYNFLRAGATRLAAQRGRAREGAAALALPQLLPTL